MSRKLTPSEKRARGTWRPARDARKVECAEPDAAPKMPHWLSAPAKRVWRSEIRRIVAAGLVTELDSITIAHFCELEAQVRLAWKAGALPKSAHLVELRRVRALLGLAGKNTRMQEIPPAAPPENRFLRYTRPENRFARNVRPQPAADGNVVPLRTLPEEKP